MGPSRRRLVIFVGLPGLLWGVRQWWSARFEPPEVPRPATPWPPVTQEPVGPDQVPSAATPTTHASTDEAGPQRWVEPVHGECPETHPIKAKERSHIYHLPGMVAYSRTMADRCYRTGEDAESDGFRPARR